MKLIKKKMTKRNNHYAMAVITTESWQSGFDEPIHEDKKYIVIRIKPDYSGFRSSTSYPKKRFNDADEAMIHAKKLADKYGDLILFDHQAINNNDHGQDGFLLPESELARIHPVSHDDIIGVYLKEWYKGSYHDLDDPLSPDHFDHYGNPISLLQTPEQPKTWMKKNE